MAVRTLNVTLAGAVSAGVEADKTDALKAYGLNLGLAFQLVDDALDYGGTTEALGKNAGDDFREGKATLPLLLAIARSGPREADFWERAVGRREQTEADFRRARELIIGTGALDATLDLATDYADKAKAASLATGGYIALAQNMNHYAFTDTGVTIQITSHGPFQIIYVNPADDPRNAKGQERGE